MNKAFIKNRTQTQADTEIKANAEIRKDKTSEVLRHLKENRSITSMDAFSLYGATRLSAIIFNLRKKGYEIRNNTEKCIDRYGHKCSFARYTLVDDGMK